MPLSTFMRVDLPAPFSPHQRVDFSLFHLQVYIVKGFYSGEGLGDISHFQKYLCHSIPPTTIQAGVSPRLYDSHLFRPDWPVHLITLTGLPCNSRNQSAFLCNYQLLQQPARRDMWGLRLCRYHKTWYH